MKNLILSTIFAVVSFCTNAQIINVQTFEFQQVKIKTDFENSTSDTTYSEPYQFTASYTFDLTQNTLTSFIDNKSVTANLVRYEDLPDGSMLFVYLDSPTSGWSVNMEKQKVSFLQMVDIHIYLESRITKSIFIIY
jgi:hypothetical protein